MSASHPAPLPAVSTPQLLPIVLGALPAGLVAGRIATWLLVPGDDEPLAGASLLVVGYFAPSCAVLAWVWFFAVWDEPGGWRNVGFAPLSGHWRRVSLFAGFACFLLAGLLIALFQPLLGSPRPPPPFLHPNGAERNPLFVAVVLFMACAAAPLVEELIFRGVLFAWLRQRWGLGLSALLSALPHALLHLDPAAMPALTVIFIIFAVLYENSRSLWAPVLAHGLYNLTSAVWSLSTASP